MTHETCTKTPVGVTLKVIGGKWKPLILWHLCQKTTRFNELMRLMEGITQKMLTQELRELEGDGLITRKIYPEIPPRVEYSLTPHGKSVRPVLQKMAQWGKAHSSLHIGKTQ